jgi:hypothetical protein
MKKIFLAIFFFASAFVLAQAPQGINYQGVARDNTGASMGNTNIGVQFKIWQGVPNSGTLVYSEVHSVMTDTFGLYSLVIGAGSGTGNFSSIPWSGGNLWVEVFIDPSNTGTFTSAVAAQQLMSVPYALYAATAGSGGGGTVSGTPHNIPKLNPAGNGIKKSLIFERTDSSGIGIGTPSPNTHAVLDIMNTGPSAGAGRGLLIPRMLFAERNAMTSSLGLADNGLLVYQTNSGGVTAPQGFWYYDGTLPGWLLMDRAGLLGASIMPM